MSIFKKSLACILLLCAQGVLVAQEQISQNTAVVEQAVSEENNAQETQEKQSFYKARRRKKKEQWSVGKTAFSSGVAGGVVGFIGTVVTILYMQFTMFF